MDSGYANLCQGHSSYSIKVELADLDDVDDLLEAIARKLNISVSSMMTSKSPYDDPLDNETQLAALSLKTGQQLFFKPHPIESTYKLQFLCLLFIIHNKKVLNAHLAYLWKV